MQYLPSGLQPLLSLGVVELLRLLPAGAPALGLADSFALSYVSFLLFCSDSVLENPSNDRQIQGTGMMEMC